MPKKLDRCVKAVKKKGYDNPWPICVAALKKGKDGRGNKKTSGRK